VEILEQAGAQVTYCEDEVGHKVSVTCVRALKKFLTDKRSSPVDKRSSPVDKRSTPQHSPALAPGASVRRTACPKGVVQCR
jgi:hypothetical protein